MAWNHTGGSGLTVGNDVTDVKQLSGKTVAVTFWYSIHNVVLQALLKENGLTPVTKKVGELKPNEVQLVIMAPSDMVPALAAKQIAGYIVAEPFNAAAEALGVGKVLRFTGDVWKDHACCVVFMQERDLNERPEWSQKVVDAMVKAQLWTHVALSLKRIAVGLGLAVLIGVPVGLAVGASSAFEAATTPAFQLLRMISPLSWMPIAVMMLGVGNKPIYFLLTFAAVWPILLNTAAGVRALDRRWLLLAESLAATRWELLTRVIVPGVVSHVLTGVRLAIGILWIVLVPCEMLGVSAGLGYFILDTRDRLAYSELAAVVIVIGVLGFLLDAAARAAHRAWLAGSA